MDWYEVDRPLGTLSIKRTGLPFNPDLPMRQIDDNVFIYSNGLKEIEEKSGAKGLETAILTELVERIFLKQEIVNTNLRPINITKATKLLITDPLPKNPNDFKKKMTALGFDIDALEINEMQTDYLERKLNFNYVVDGKFVKEAAEFCVAGTPTDEWRVNSELQKYLVYRNGSLFHDIAYRVLYLPGDIMPILEVKGSKPLVEIGGRKESAVGKVPDRSRLFDFVGASYTQPGSYAYAISSDGKKIPINSSFSFDKEGRLVVQVAFYESKRASTHHILLQAKEQGFPQLGYELLEDSKPDVFGNWGTARVKNLKFLIPKNIAKSGRIHFRNAESKIGTAIFIEVDPYMDCIENKLQKMAIDPQNAYRVKKLTTDKTDAEKIQSVTKPE